MYVAGTAGEQSFQDEVTIPNTFFFKLNFRLDVENSLSHRGSELPHNNALFSCSHSSWSLLILLLSLK